MTRGIFGLTIILTLTSAIACSDANPGGTPTTDTPAGGNRSAKGVPAATERGLPTGFRQLPASRGTGAVIATTRQDASPVRALGSALETLTDYFGAAVRPLHVVASRDGSAAQASFTGQRAQQAVRGVAFAHKTGEHVSVGIIYDHADRFAASFGALAETWIATVPAARRAEAPLERRRLPDGSGAIAVPAGWTVNATNAMVSAEGPEGAADLGIWTQVYTPDAAAMMPMQPPLVAPYGDPGRAYQVIMSRTMRLPAGAIDILERSRIDWWPQGPAEMLHVTIDAPGKRMEGLAMVLTSPAGMGQWMFYMSSVGAPQGAFAENLPTLMKIWASWKTDDRVFQERLQKAAESLRQVNQIIRDVNSTRQAAMDRAATAWDHYIRDTWPVEDAATGRRADAFGDTNEVVESLNRAEGYDRYRVVPFGELGR